MNDAGDSGLSGGGERYPTLCERGGDPATEADGVFPEATSLRSRRVEGSGRPLTKADRSRSSRSILRKCDP